MLPMGLCRSDGRALAKRTEPEPHGRRALQQAFSAGNDRAQEWCDPAHFVHPAPLASLRFHSSYAAAKGAPSPYNKGLANEVGPKGVRVNMISPGFVETSGAHGMIVGLAKSKGIDENAARQEIVDMIGGIPMGRPAHPEEIAELAAFLASARAAHPWRRLRDRWWNNADYLIAEYNGVPVPIRPISGK